jgi:hypothetical protein
VSGVSERTWLDEEMTMPENLASEELGRGMRLSGVRGASTRE